MKITEEIAANAGSAQAWRRDIHAHPELCFQETRTADLMARLLTGWDIPVERGRAGT